MDNLQEAYLSVYQELDEATKAETHKEKKDPSFSRRVARNARYREENPTAGTNAQLLRQMAHASRRGVKKEEFDLFDYLLEYLVAEGYADTNENAIAIMANMSEEWKQSIIEETARTKYLQKKFDKENKNKSGSALTAIPGKQNTGQALQKARQSERHMRGDV
jgi:hypothetical protein